MNNNLLCCIECLINKTIICEYCIEYCEYDHKKFRQNNNI